MPALKRLKKAQNVDFHRFSRKCDGPTDRRTVRGPAIPRYAPASTIDNQRPTLPGFRAFNDDETLRFDDESWRRLAFVEEGIEDFVLLGSDKMTNRS